MTNISSFDTDSTLEMPIFVQELHAFQVYSIH